MLLTDDEGERPAKHFDAIQCVNASLLLLLIVISIIIITITTTTTTTTTTIKFVSP